MSTESHQMHLWNVPCVFETRRLRPVRDRVVSVRFERARKENITYDIFGILIIPRSNIKKNLIDFFRILCDRSSTWMISFVYFDCCHSLFTLFDFSIFQGETKNLEIEKIQPSFHKKKWRSCSCCSLYSPLQEVRLSLSLSLSLSPLFKNIYVCIIFIEIVCSNS